MSVEVGSAFVSIVPSMRGLQGQLSRGLDGPARQAGTRAGRTLGDGLHAGFRPSLGKLTAGIGAAFAGMKVGSFLSSAVSQASDLNESMGKVRIVFGASSQQVEAFAKNAATSLGQSQQQALEAAGTFGNLFRAMSLGPGTAAKMSTTLVKLATDMGSFNNVDPAEAILALRSALSGETEPMRRFGVNISQAAIEAKAMSSGIVKSSVNMDKLRGAQLRLTTAQIAAQKVAKNARSSNLQRQKVAVAVAAAESALAGVMKGKAPQLNAAQKAQATYALVLEQTRIQQGNFALTSGDLAGQQRILASQFTDLKARLGGQLLPAAVGVARYFSGTLLPAIGKFSPVLDRIKGAVQRFATPFTEFFAGVKAQAGPSGQAIYDFGIKVGDAFRTAKRLATDFFDGLRAQAGPSGQVMFDFGVRVRDVVTKLFDGVKVNIGPLISSITTQLSAVGQPIIDALRTGIETGNFSGLGLALGQALAASMNGAVAAVGAITKALGKLLDQIDFVGLGIDLGRQVPSLLIGLAAGILNFDFMGLLSGLAGHWKDILIAVLAVAFTPGRILAKVGEMLARIPLAGRLLAWAFGHFVTLSKGLVRFAGEAIGFIGRAFLSGFREIFPGVGAKLAENLALLPLRIGLAGIKAGEAVGTLIGRIIGGFISGVARVSAAAGRIVATVIKAFAGADGWLIDAGKDLIRGFINGIGQMFGAVKGKLGDLTGKLTSWKGPASRDRVILHPAGQMVIDGFVHGLESRYDRVRGSLQGLTADLAVNAGAGASSSGSLAGGGSPRTLIVQARTNASAMDIADEATRRALLGVW